MMEAPMPVTIPLPATNTAIIVDEADYEAVSAHGWCVNSVGYVVASRRNVGIQLSRFLLDVPDGYVAIHRNGDLLDF